MKLATLSAVVALDAMDGAVEPAIAHFLDQALAETVMQGIVEAGTPARVDLVEAILFEEAGEALPRLGGARVKISASVETALAAWKGRTT